jgi:hypothetical protein
MFKKAEELIDIERKYLPDYNSKRRRAHDKLDCNLKRMLNHLPKEIKEMTVDQLLTEFNGDFDYAANCLVKVQNPDLCMERTYDSPPKVESKKHKIKKRFEEN